MNTLARKNKSVTKGRPNVLTIILFVLLIVYVVGLFIPIIWSIIVSLLENQQYKVFYFYKAFKNFKFQLTFDNFVNAWKYLTVTSIETHRHPETTYNILGLYSNSILYSVGCALAFTIVPCVVGYAAARFKFKFSKIIYGFVIVTMALPIVGSMSSELRMVRFLGIDETFVGMWILRANFLSIYFLIFYAQFETIPFEYTEAAKIDGAGNARIMFRVILPQALGTLVTVFILTFITYWNDYQIPLVYLPSKPTAAYAVYTFFNVAKGGNITSLITVQMAGTIIMTLPIIAVFAIFNKRIRVGVSMGGIKG